MDSYETKAIVVGAGVVGLAVARNLAQSGHETIVVERAAMFGTETSSRNSEVIHAGIYYPKGSLMAETCVAGRHRLYDFCETRKIPHRKLGKLIVATSPEEAARLEGIAAAASANGVDDLKPLDRDAVAGLEPELRCEAALLSPSTGIIDSHAYMLALKGEAEDAGAAFAFRSPVLAIRRDRGQFEIDVGGDHPARLRAPILVNAAGLFAPAVAGLLDALDQDHIPTPYFAKGCYFTLQGRSPFSRLIYPVPVPGGLGTHLTLDLAGQARFGPDVEWVEHIDYTVDPKRAEGFYEAIRRYWPGLPGGSLQPAYSGIRPKIVPPTVAKQDFVIQGPARHGLPGLVNLFGIESPGLTASLALADRVGAMLSE